MKRRETAGGLLPSNNGLAPDAPKQFAPDNVLVGVGNIEYRMQDMLRRRHNASISGQHRTVQRFDKQLQLLRAALGMDPNPPPETTRTHRNGKDPTNGENLMIATAKTAVASGKFFVRLEGKKGHKVSTIQHGDHEDHAGKLAVERMNKHEKHAEHGPFKVSSCKPMSKKAWHAALAAKKANIKKATKSQAADMGDQSNDGKEITNHEGFQAAQSGKGANTCPHPYDTAKRQHWLDGHNRYHNEPAPTGHSFQPSTSFSSDLEWARKVTATSLAMIIANLHARGYEYAAIKKDALVVHSWKGFRGPQPDSWEITMIGRDWCTAAVHNNERISAFAFTTSTDKVEQGIPVQITASTWDGRLDAKTRQGYAAGWAHVMKEICR